MPAGSITSLTLFTKESGTVSATGGAAWGSGVRGTVCGASGSRTVLLGDFNSNASNPADPASAAYRTIRNGGYSDAWLVNGNAAGFTCCQEEDLKNTTYVFTLEDGSEIEVRGDEEIEYDGEKHTAANLFDALKEGYYGKF